MSAWALEALFTPMIYKNYSICSTHCDAFKLNGKWRSNGRYYIMRITLSSEEEEEGGEESPKVALDNKLLERHMELTEERCKYANMVVSTFDCAVKESLSPSSCCKITLFRVSKAEIHKDHIERVYAQYFRCKTTHIVEHTSNVEHPHLGEGVLLHNMNDGFECYLEHIRNKDATIVDLTPYPNWRREGGMCYYHRD